jgi:hypothetical protein
VAIIFEFESILKATIERLKEIEDFKGFEHFFIFKTNEDLKENFFNNWRDLKEKSNNFI